MCGIAGYFFGNKSYGWKVDLSNVATFIEHRGPDDSGIFENRASGVGLVHTRLSIQDISSRGHQPMSSEDRNYVLVYNGEIYNFLELRDELQQIGYNFASESDTEVVLKLCQICCSQGVGIEGALKKFNGIFSLAFWDAKSQTIMLARDPLGVKPLYYSQTSKGFIFASEIKALQWLLKNDLDFCFNLDKSAIGHYLSFLWCPGDSTPLTAVKKLEPGEVLYVRKGLIFQKYKWYSLPTFRVKQEPMSARSAIKKARDHLRHAVQRQLVSDVPVGAFLSGGLDSSSVVAFARQQVPNIQCFTIKSKGQKEDGLVDDFPYAVEVARHLNVPLNVVEIDATRMAHDLSYMVSKLDEPLADLAPLNVFYISRLARENGIKVLLSGTGGDDILTGYRRHYAVTLEKYWSWLPRPVRQCLKSLTQQLSQDNAWQRRLTKAFESADLDSDARLINYFRYTEKKDLIPLYTRDFKSEVDSKSDDNPMDEFLKDIPSDRVMLDRMLALDQRFFLADHNLIYTDKMSMAVGVEVRVPFLDLDFVEFAAKLPVAFKQCGSDSKWVLKKAMEPYLPRKIIYRPKTGFGAPIRQWIRSELKDFVLDILSEDSLRRRGLFEPSAVHRLIRANYEGKLDASHTILSLVCVELWCRNFIDNRGSIALAHPNV